LKRLLPLALTLALAVVLVLPGGAAGASPGPAKGLGSICERVEGGSWDAASLTCEGLHIEATRPVNAICEQALGGLVAYRVTIVLGHGIIPDGWACGLP